jgi:hypothetical protein
VTALAWGLAQLSVGALPLGAAEEVTRLKWLAALPPWATFLIVAAFVVWAGVIYRRERTSRGWLARGFLTTLRVLACVALLLMLYHPVETTTREEVRPSYVAVMVDTSVSMSLVDRLPDPAVRRALAEASGLGEAELSERSRLALVQRMLTRGDGTMVRRLLEKNRVKLYAFSSRATPLGELRRDDEDGAADGDGVETLGPVLERVNQLEATGGETALGDCLSRVLADLRGKNVAGIVLLSDGRTNAGAVPPPSVSRRLHRRGIALYAVGVGNPEEPVDIVLSDLDAARVVRAGDVLQVTAVLRATGFEEGSERVDLEVRLDDELVHTEPVDLRPSGEGARGGPTEYTREVAVRLQPEVPGEYTLSLSVEPRPGELIRDNNRLQQRLRVIDKRIKVLYIENLPRYEYRFLRWGLVRDRNMEAQIFQISADPEYVQDSSPGVPPLSRVPSTREELFAYHVVILGDVDPYGPQMGEERLKLLKEFVEDFGGGLLVISGRMFTPRSYAGTPLESLLPVRIDPGDDGLSSLGSVIRQSFQPKLTLDGRRHPLMRLENDPERNRSLWEGARLPGFYWYHKAREVKPGAEVLAVHPEQRTQKGDPVPIFAIQPAGAGTTFYSATDDIWRWRAGVGDRYTYRLWGQVVRYLAAGRLLTSRRFSITTDRSVYDLGDRVLVSAEVRDRDLKPSEQETANAFLETPDGEISRFELARTPGVPGQFRAELTAEQVGAYRVWLGPEGSDAAAPAPGEELAVRIFSAQVPELEKADPRTDSALLESMARETEGAYLTLAEVDRLPEMVGTVREVVEVRLSERERWDEWWAILVVVGLLGLEWALRRRWEML